MKFEYDKKQVISVSSIMSLSTKFHDIIGLVTEMFYVHQLMHLFVLETTKIYIKINNKMLSP